jgi:hypothetical protein
MPTGYTADIAKGITFQQFAMNCARAFGALIMMRDEPSDAEIPAQFEPSTHYVDWANEARAKLATMQAMSIAEVERAAEDAYSEQLASWQRSRDEAVDLRNKYNAMLAQAVQWTPPTPEHEGLLDFMVKQIQESIKFDCYEMEPPSRREATSWHNEQIAHLKKNIVRYDAEQAQEVERTRGRNDWVSALRDSLKVSATPPAQREPNSESMRKQSGENPHEC